MNLAIEVPPQPLGRLFFEARQLRREKIGDAWAGNFFDG